jgi:hypothetical protein
MRLDSQKVVARVLFTNGSLSRAARNRANEKGVEIIQGVELARLAVRLGCSFGDVESSENRRLSRSGKFGSGAMTRSGSPVELSV